MTKVNILLVSHTIALVCLIVGHYRQNLAIEKLSEKHLNGAPAHVPSPKYAASNYEDADLPDEPVLFVSSVSKSDRNIISEWEEDLLKRSYPTKNNGNARKLNDAIGDVTENRVSTVFDRDERNDFGFFTSCFPVEDGDTSNYSEADTTTDFRFRFQLKTDSEPEETSWWFLRHKDDYPLIDSDTDHSNTEFLPNSLHEFQYHCLISDTDPNENNTPKKYCYDFEVYDSGHDGLCCAKGLGYFNIYLNGEAVPVVSERFYNSASILSSFCVDDEGKHMKEEKIQDVSSYPSRECVDGECVCDSNPPLFEKSDRDTMGVVKLRSLLKIMSLSGSEKLLDIKTPQYKAACWVLNDDKYLFQDIEDANLDTSTFDRTEKRIVQRYILALFYFATTPKNWTYHHHFLSSRSECQWNTVDVFNEYDDKQIRGALCDDENNVISLTFWSNNLDGTIIEELYGLQKLEQFEIQGSEKLHGTIPPSVGRLKELRSFWILGESAVSGTIPKEIFDITTMNTLLIGRTEITGTIPENVSNLKRLSNLNLYKNKLSGSIPDGVYSLKELVYLALNDNNLTSTLSPFIGNLRKVEQLWLENNNLYGHIPESIGSVYDILYSNRVHSSGRYRRVNLHGNGLNGKVPEQLCGKNMLHVTSDCRNDITQAEVTCSCCYYCSDKTPVWDGDCADTTINVEIHHARRPHELGYFRGNSDELQWKMTDERIQKDIFHYGPYERLTNTRPTYKACVSNSGFFSLKMITPPEEDTGFSIFWNNKLIHSDDFDSKHSNTSSNYPRTMVNFQYDAMTEEFVFGEASYKNLQIVCGENETIVLQNNSTQQIMYSAAVRISGIEKIQDTTSAQSRAVCWVLHDDDFFTNHYFLESKEALEILCERFVQRYVLTLLHLTSVGKLFGSDEYPPLTHECEWDGISCIDKRWKTVTTLSLSPEANQIIGGTLIEEIGSLAYLEVLELKHTQLEGSIPDVLSNLYSLRKLDLSMNNLTTSIPANFFNELKMLEVLDLSKNDMTGLIPENVGLYSDMSEIALSGNSFTGLLPLDNFSSHNLIYLDVSDNQFSGNISSSLLKHTRLEHLNLGNNLFVGTLGEYTLHDLSNLRYLNVSNNELIGLIPAVHNNKESNMTHFDISANRFFGTLPSSITHMSKAVHLNLQGNWITGVIPNGINDLEKLRTLALSHNALKGSIPLNLTQLANLKELYLHGNQLTGKAPDTKREMDYVTDCGFPSTSLERITCPSCNICCNAENLCAEKTKSVLQPPVLGMLFFVIVAVSMTLVYKAKDRIIRMKSLKQHFEEKVSTWVAADIIGEKSVYHFFLTQNTYGWYIGLFCAVAQLFTLFLFLRAADISIEGSDLRYTKKCPRNSLECKDARALTTYGVLIFALILGAWMLRDIISSIRLFMLAMWKKNIDLFFASMIIFLVSIFSVWTSAFYNYATGTKDTELIVNAVILLFVNELDERLYQLVEACDSTWVSEVDESYERRSYFDRNRLLLSRGLHKIDKRLQNLLPERFSQRELNNSDPNLPIPEGTVENENIELSVESADLEKKE